MSAPRELPRRDYLAIRQAERDLVTACGGPSNAARHTRISQQAISRCLSADEEHALRFLPIDVVADLEAACGQPIVSRAVASLLFFVLVPAPEALRVSGGALDLVQKVSALLAEVSDVSGGVAESLRDGAVSNDERVRLHREVREAMQALIVVDRQLDLAADECAEPDDD